MLLLYSVLYSTYVHTVLGFFLDDSECSSCFIVTDKYSLAHSGASTDQAQIFRMQTSCNSNLIIRLEYLYRRHGPSKTILVHDSRIFELYVGAQMQCYINGKR